jgi:coenzyme Q-binding protein COQ10
MPSFRTTRRVRHSAADMFDLVADVEKYPLFLPLCTGLRVRSRAQDAQGREVLTADMSVGYKAVRETFTSRVTLDRAACEILVVYIDGPFSRLDNRWSFRDLEGAEGRAACEVGFFIDYEFRSRMLGVLMGAMFETAFRRFAEAFEARADLVYGRRPRPPAAPPAPPPAG